MTGIPPIPTPIFNSRRNVSLEAFSKKIAGYIKEHQSTFNFANEMFLQPLLDIHLRSDFNGDKARLGNINHIYILSIIAFFILIIACINFMEHFRPPGPRTG